jgi:hypothetical protein
MEFNDIVEGQGDETCDCNNSWETLDAAFANAAVGHLELSTYGGRMKKIKGTESQGGNMKLSR